MTSKQQQKYNKDAIGQIDIANVAEALGMERKGNTKYFKCHDEKTPSAVIYPQTNSYCCFGCGLKGDGIAIVQQKQGFSYHEACEWLHNEFNIPFLDGSSACSYTPPPKKVHLKIRLAFDFHKDYTNVVIKNWLPKYSSLSDAQKMKIIYTTVYRFSLATDQAEKLAWYANKRGIKEHYLLDQIGWLNKGDLKKLTVLLESKFPMEDLVRFKVYNDGMHEKNPLKFRYFTDAAFSVVPFHELYSDMVNGLMLRNTSPNAGKKKEFQISCSEFAIPIPFALDRYLLSEGGEDYVFVTEGHIDGMSLGGKPFVASPGTYGIKDECLGLLADKKIYILFDEDKPGRVGAINLYERLKAEGHKEVYILEWDWWLGNDLNDLLRSGDLKPGMFRKKQFSLLSDKPKKEVQKEELPC